VSAGVRRARELAERRPMLAAAALYLVLGIVLLAPGLVPGHTLSGSDYLWTAAPWDSLRPEGVRPLGANPELVDPATQHQPFLEHTRGALPDVPLWNPHLMGGRPFVANAQSAVFSPFSLPSYLLPFWWSLSVVALLKLLVASLGAFALARALGMRMAGALLCGLVFGFGLFFVVWLPWPLTSIWALMPWLMLATDRLVRRPGPLPAAALAGLVALQYFGGHPESSFHVMVAVLAFGVLRLVQARRGEVEGAPRSPWRTVGLAVGAIALGTALAAVAIAPFVELLAHSADIVYRGDDEPSFLPRRYLLAALVPDYWGKPTQTPFEGFMVQRAFYAGALPLVLAAAALVLRPTLERVSIAAFGAAAMLVVFGVPPVFDAVTALPGFNTVHNTRLPIVFMLCVALLAGRGLDELVARAPSSGRARLLLALAAGLLALPVVWMAVAGHTSLDRVGDGLEVALGLSDPPPATDPSARQIVRLAAILPWLLFAGLALALVAARVRGRLATGVFAALAVGLVAADLLRAGLGQNPAQPVERAEQPATGAIRHLQRQGPARFVGVPVELGPAPVPPDVALRYGLYDARGYDYPVERRYDRLWRREVTPPEPLTPGLLLARVNERSLHTLGLFGVRSVLQGRDQPPLQLPGLRVAYDGPDGRVYEHTGALPRAFLVSGQRVVEGEDAALAAVTARDFDGRREVVTERRLPGLSEGPAPSPGEARISTYEPERVVVETRARRPAELVLTDVSFVGWNATVDGRDVPLDRVDYLFRGVRVPAGAHTVELRYEPASWRIGLAVSGVALVVLVGLVAIGLRQRRASPTTRPVARPSSRS
jgi:hypothetical protein